MGNTERFRVQIGVINKQLGGKDGPSKAELTVRVFGSPSLKKKGVHVETGSILSEVLSTKEGEELITELTLHIKNTAFISIGE